MTASKAEIADKMENDTKPSIDRGKNLGIINMQLKNFI